MLSGGAARRWLVLVGVAFLVVLFYTHGGASYARLSAGLRDDSSGGAVPSPLAKDVDDWTDRLGESTPVTYNPHAPVKVTSASIEKVDMNGVTTTAADPAKRKERVLILSPLRDAAPYLSTFLELIEKLSYPHNLIDLAFLVGDSTDETHAILASELDRLQQSPAKFGSVKVVRKDFGAGDVSQDVTDRHAFAYQAIRRKSLGKARNYLLSAALGPRHSWVLWLDSDIVEMPTTLIEDLARHDADVIVPAIWFHRNDDYGVDLQGRFDYNSWIESDTGRKLTKKLDPDVVLAEGYKEYDTKRTYLCKMGELDRDPAEEVELDGIGGVVILVKADVHRMGINFPAYAFENQAETEGFGKMARRAGLGVVGLPNYVVWHIDTEEKPGNAAKNSD